MAAAQTTAVEAPRQWIGAVQDEWAMYSCDPNDYTIGMPIGFGASSIVYSAEYHPSDSKKRMPVALKVVDLERLAPSALRLLTRETQLTSLSKHPNVLRVRGTWVQNYKLYIALRLMRSGSISDVMRYKFTSGVEEEVARCILKQALEGLHYLHVNGLVHRDIKAANLLLDDDGTVLVGDLGVAASLSDEDAHNHAANIPVIHKPHKINPDGSYSHPPLQFMPRALGKRKSFVGTPCWMAPEIIAQKHYDASADIWSLGITALELCNGRAPHSRDRPAQVLQKILHQAAPTLDRKGGQHQYSKEFKEIIESCLIKDPTKRPTTAQLLDTPYFKGAKRKSYLISTLIDGLPPLTDRQERRKQPSIASFPSDSSWDFSSTLHFTPPVSPTQSLARSPNRARTRDSSIPHTAVFEIEDVGEGDAIPQRSPSGGLGSRTSSRVSMGPHPLSTMSARQVSISEEDYTPAHVFSETVPVSIPKDVPEVVSKSFSSSSSSSNAIGPATPPANNFTARFGGKSMWRKLTGKTNDVEEEMDTVKPKMDKLRSSFGALLERKTSRK